MYYSSPELNWLLADAFSIRRMLAPPLGRFNLS